MKTRLWLLAAAFFAFGVVASPIHVFNSGDALTSADINANFSHIHSMMVGGHGPKLTNSDVNASAAIAHTKLATPALLPKLWWSGTTACTTTPCASADSSGFSLVTRSAAGTYLATFSLTRVDANYGIWVTTLASGLINCVPTGRNAGSVAIGCTTVTTGVATDASFSILILDSSN
jgi:hypothetical protein